MNKRGDVNWFLISLIMALIILASTGYFSGKLFAQTADAINEGSATELQTAITSCRAQSTLSGVQDFDQDKLADFCDPCVNGDDNIQSDGDFLADPCDTAKTNKDVSGMIACCGDAQKKSLDAAITKYKLAQTQTDRAAALAEANKYCQNKLRNIKPLQCCAGSCPTV